MTATKLFNDFFNSEKSSGIILIISTVASLLLANFFIGENYLDFWHQKMGFSIGGINLNLSIEHWVNDGLMTIFFLLVGLEIERELYAGELSSIKNASLPVIAAVGGMAIPALLHFIFNAGTNTQSGFGIPMATDIAFALGVLSLAGKRVPLALKIFLTALAIIDDLGAIMIIAIFYTSELQTTYLFIALGIFALLLVLNRLKVHQLIWYILGGVIMWYCMLQSGVHATITGVLLAFAIPFGDGKENSPSYLLQHWLHKPVAFIIVPIFAFANTGIIFSGNLADTLTTNNSLGIIAGLLIGKPLGILLLCFIAIKLRLAKLPEEVNWMQLAGAGVLAGIGFTMSIFITLLAFEEVAVIQQSKIAILFSSLFAGVIGFLLVKKSSATSIPE
ncbi:Na+/H+ antiporter NhaA [Chitinophagaceae bacterium IBVUCB2]|nr:Na+/H+ antiporter NhaA [Chitinophagaceae bacterium IBVUCB2]